MDIQTPTSFAEVEQLVERLYSPNQPQVIARIQEVLQQVQRSSEGWQLASALLERPNVSVRFFGALTVIVKLNTERHSLSDDDANAVLHQLVTWLITSTQDQSAVIVTKKLCSALVTHFIHYSHVWQRPVGHLVRSLQNGQPAPVEDSPARVGEAIEAFSTERALTAIWFTASLVEEAGKTDLKSTKYIGLHERLVASAEDLTALLGSFLRSSGNNASAQVRQEAITCLNSWITYAQKISKHTLTSALQSLITPTIECLLVDDLFESSVELLTSTLEDWESFFTAEHYSILYSVFQSPWAQQRYQTLRQGDFEFESLQFGLFMIAFATSRVAELTDSSNPSAQSILTILVDLLKVEGHPTVEDKIFVPLLEFWSNFVDTLTIEYSGDLVWDQPPLTFVKEVVSHSWRKIQYPSSSTYVTWDSSEKAGFGDARRDVADLLQLVHGITGPPLVALFVDYIMQALEQTNWTEVESATFCLGALSDSVSDDTCDDILVKVFGSPLFELLRQRDTVPGRARRTCLSLIERYSEFFGRHERFLAPALNLLFSAVDDQQLAISASKSVHTLCSSCRQLLGREVDAFIGQYESLRSSRELESIVEERIVGAIAAIIQAITETQIKAEAFRRLILVVSQDVTASLQLHSTGSQAIEPQEPILRRAYDPADLPTVPVPASEVAVLLATRSLRCLLSIAKGLQAPSEPEDLDAASGADGTKTTPEALAQTQMEILTVLAQLKDTFSYSTEAVDVLCAILRTGFPELDPGPFVFEPHMVTEFLTSAWQNRISTVVNTASAFLSSLHHGKSGKEDVETALRRLLQWTLSVLHQLNASDDDPELAQYGVELVQKAIVQRPEVVMSQSPESLEFIFEFALKLLRGSEPLPKAAAADFWATLIVAKSADPNTQAALSSALNHVGPVLCQALMQNVGGNAARSELDKLCDPIKKLITASVHARQWLESALADPAFPSDKVSAKEKELFVKKLVALRGQRATNQVVREFWLECRGQAFMYAS
ncbi:armadillo-type protein [Microdochium trichocladiopsis]|uniref:Armadillo-type protein n=1 Tax=Microdochium trichocladiopsis TaxID=1682393 RepID=A0A9P8YEJ5_9PEZI|nr:armadillo-type protein [Microdochium trichocladiopsis]KAH7038000.1 armadillo-type protein [Microdochium trichocladiopsis]